MASSLMPTQSTSSLNSSSYQVENDALVESTSQSTPDAPVASNPPPNTNILPPTLNINELFQKLVATGIVTTVQDNQPTLITPASSLLTSVGGRSIPAVTQKKESLPPFKPVNFGKPETLKM